MCISTICVSLHNVREKRTKEKRKRGRREGEGGGGGKKKLKKEKKTGYYMEVVQKEEACV